MSAATDVHPLDRVRIASPCSADWDAMTRIGSADQARHCADCDKNVYDISALTRAEATAFLAGHTGQEPPCLRLWRRPDGTVLTADCPTAAAEASERSEQAGNHTVLAARVRGRVLKGWARIAALFGLSLGSLSTSGCLMGVQDRDWCAVPPPPVVPPVVLRRAPQELSRDLHDLVPKHQLIPDARHQPRRLPRAE